VQKKLTVQGLMYKSKKATAKEFLELTNHVTALLSKEHKSKNPEKSGRLLRLPAEGEAIIVGDLHGDLGNLSKILRMTLFMEKAEKDQNIRLIFLGDYGDRGTSSPEVYYVVLKLKDMFPRKVVLMRGNHEGPEDMIPSPHDLPMQLMQKYGDDAEEIYMQLRILFNELYNAVIINKQYLLIHGGASSKAHAISDLALSNQKHPAESHLEEMLWNDPTEETEGVQASLRGAGKQFGIKVTQRILKLTGTKILIRGHQACTDGYKINHKGKVLTLFSVNKPPYSNAKAAFLQLDLATPIEDAYQLEKQIVKLTTG
jgi:diadenosine tetraphosphatase ApaH/serine/threonine PP2A family protein phosphatase